jgi:hypothetical protein
MILPISASQVAQIKEMSHHAGLAFYTNFLSSSLANLQAIFS